MHPVADDGCWAYNQRHSLLPGFLGTENSFRQRFTLPIEREKSGEASSKLNRLVNPFILRRVKTDKKIISDLPEKNEMKVFVPITKEQEIPILLIFLQSGLLPIPLLECQPRELNPLSVEVLSLSGLNSTSPTGTYKS